MKKGNGKGFDISCDFCTHNRRADTTDWREMMEEQKGLGWAVRKENDEWIDYCPECKKERLGKGK